ncbi:MAG: CBS and ACT domain-containing protein [Deferrisomatales bacterium]
MLVKHLMTPNPVGISPEQSVADAAALMTERGIRHLPVVDENGVLVGLVTRSSLAQALPGLGTGLTRFEYSYLTANTKIREVMIAQPVLGEEDMAAEEAARIMNEHRISSLLVLRDGRPVGIITDTDIFEAMLELLGARREGVRLTVHLPDRPGELAKVSSRIAELGGNLSAVGGWPVGPDTWGAVLKVQNLDPDRVAEALRAMPGVTLVDVRG